MDNRLIFDYNYLMDEFVKDGISYAELEAYEGQVKEACKILEEKRANGAKTLTQWMNLPYIQEEIVADILATAEKVKREFESFVVLGIGGSALGPIAVHQALNHIYYNEVSKESRNGCPKFYVIDNVDPERMSALLDVVDVNTTMFNVITKSGSTSETMAQFLLVKSLLVKALGEDYKKHLILTTDAEKGNLAKIAREEGLKKYIVPDGVGGRFSELCPVGLLPAAVCGIDIEAMLEGAAKMDEICKNPNVMKNPAALFAVQQVIAMKKGKNISVMMPYADSLKYIADWYAQLWAESLGKRYDNEGHEVLVGQTPVKALGVTDQHSQVQLYTEGPFDKVVVLLGVEEYKTTLTIPKLYQDIPSLGIWGGVTQNQLIQTEQMATEYALLKSGRPNLTITLPRVNEFMLGQLLYFFEVATAFTGELLQINAFDQPGVEEGKNATYAMFGRPGYEEKKRELEMRPAKKDCYIL